MGAMPSTHIATGGDAGYFPLIDELCASVRALRPAEALGLAVIDAGLKPAQAAHLAARWGARILEVGWGDDLKVSRVRGREHLKVQIARAWLDTLLPEAETIAWIDGDAWVQHDSGLDLLFRGAATGRLAIVSQTSRYSDRVMTLGWAAFGYAKVKAQLYKNARRAGLPEAVARRIGDRPTLNAGVFALPADASHWKAWRERQSAILRGRGRVFTSDQLSLGLAVYEDGCAVELLPEVCNYMGPFWSCDEAQTTLVERFVPNSPVGIVHMAGYDDMRRSLEVTAPIRTLGGREIARSLRYPAWSRMSAGG